MRVTFSCMIATDGQETIIGVYRGRLSGRKGARRISFKTAQQIATVVVKRKFYWRETHPETCARLNREYATTECPALDWNA